MQRGTRPALRSEGMPVSWAEFTWPDWVPAEVRKQIQDFWDDTSRGPGAWMENAEHNRAPDLGTVVFLPKGFSNSAPLVRGRFVFAWNNIARLVLDDGTWVHTFFWPAVLADPMSYVQRHLDEARARLQQAHEQVQVQQERLAQWEALASAIQDTRPQGEPRLFFRL